MDETEKYIIITYNTTFRFHRWIFADPVKPLAKMYMYYRACGGSEWYQ